MFDRLNAWAEEPLLHGWRISSWVDTWYFVDRRDLKENNDTLECMGLKRNYCSIPHSHPRSSTGVGWIRV